MAGSLAEGVAGRIGFALDVGGSTAIYKDDFQAVVDKGLPTMVRALFGADLPATEKGTGDQVWVHQEDILLPSRP